MALTGANELWLKTVRGQDKRGVPLARRKTTNREALAQTAMLEHYRTMSHHSLADGPALPGANQCQGCGRKLPKRQRKRWKEKRAVWLASGPVRFYVCPKCS